MKKVIAAALFLVLFATAWYAMATVSSTTSQVSYLPSGTDTVFPYTFYLPAETDMEVLYLDTITGEETAITSGYTISGAGSPSGGSVTFTTAPLSGTRLVLRRNVAKTQNTDLVPNTRINAQVIENALDRLTLIDQDQQRDIDRALKLKSDTAYTSLVVPEPEAGYYLRWNDAGDNLENVAQQDISGSVTISGFGTYWIEASDGESAWAYLNGTPFTWSLLDDANQSTFLTSIGGTTLTKTLWGLSSTGTYRSTIGCGTAATYAVGTSSGTIPVLTTGGDIGNLPAVYVDHATPRKYISGFALTRHDGTTMYISGGSARDYTDNRTIWKATTWIKTYAAWVEGYDSGGCVDTPADGWWHVYVIAKEDGTYDVMFTTDASSPTLPTDFVYYRRIGSFLAASGAIVEFYQKGDLFLWVDPPADQNAAVADANAHSYTLTVPTGLEVIAKVRGRVSADYGYLSSLVVNDEWNSTTAAPLVNISQYAGTEMDILTNTSGQIRGRIGTGGSTLRIVTFGWIDRRGKDD